MHNMKYLVFIFLIVSISCQTDLTESRMEYWQSNYYPARQSTVSENDYRKAIHRLTKTYNDIRSDSTRPKANDHINMMAVFITLQEPRKKILDQLELAQKRDLETTAELFLTLYESVESFRGFISENEYDSLHNKFTKVLEARKEVELNLELYAEEGGYDLELIKLLAKLKESDQLYRSQEDADFNKQDSIDRQNLQVVDSLFHQHGQYIGESMAGPQFSSTMWFVIQHSDLEAQQRYLPIIHNAVQKNELPVTLLKMLIDRVSIKTDGYQIFGSQSSSDLAPDSVINKIKLEYGI